ncbi:DUF4406 domain-containing protein [Spirosoma taeanense]|uniref:DUF4406 domain-containing protein n=1 Tax=Spirosoma taeanense TaxID=2735870 RepID=A0A6M5YB68_9BACT|nr:DUF4406 domain-containing protein [Spirosoma taeanense]QJW90596.1 DUF4406 domain-containing protein [Spirosoma taeanense]
MLILIAGPYRSGTNDDPTLIAQNMRQMDEAALAVYRKGHTPVCGEWIALPLIRTAGSTELGDAVFTEIFHPVAIQLIDHCEGVLRVGGPSAGADEMMRQAEMKGKQTFWQLEAIE